MTFRFLHLADLHLDSAYGGRAATRRRLREATLEALHAATTFAIDERVDAVLVAGDAFDEGRLGYDARSAFRRQVGRLARVGIHFVWSTGNHDPGVAGGTARGLDLAAGDPALVHVALDATPRTFTIDRDGAPVGTVTTVGHVHTSVSDDLAARLQAPDDPAVPHVAMLHTQVGGARGADAHARYAPSSIERLAQPDFVYWALGHVHRRGRVSPDANAWYSGNLLGRNAREPGAKGGLLVEVDRDGPVNTPAFVRFAPVEFATASLEDDEAWSIESDALARRVAGTLRGASARELIVRVRVRQTIPPEDRARLDEAEERRAIEDAIAAEPVLQELDAGVLEVELVYAPAERGSGPADADLVELERQLMATPSALREAILIADELCADPSIATDWSIGFAQRAHDASRDQRVIDVLNHSGRSIANELLERLLRRADDA